MLKNVQNSENLQVVEKGECTLLILHATSQQMNQNPEVGTEGSSLMLPGFPRVSRTLE